MAGRATERRTRFHQRIAAERAILAIVNSSAASKYSLAGMTSGAIAEWEAQASVQGKTEHVRKIVELLIRIGKRAELLADDSKDVFSEQDKDTGIRLEQMKLELRRLCSLSF